MSDKFTRARLIDPEDKKRARWWSINRPRFSNDDLLRQVEAYPHLWGGRRP